MAAAQANDDWLLYSVLDGTGITHVSNNDLRLTFDLLGQEQVHLTYISGTTTTIQNLRWSVTLLKVLLLAMAR